MKEIIENALNTYSKNFEILKFYSKGFETYLIGMFILSLLLGLLEVLQLIVLYAVLEATFSLQNNRIPMLNSIFDFLRNTLYAPDIIVFCLFFIVIIFLTFLGLLVYRYLSLSLTKRIILKTKGSIFDKLVENDYQYFVDNRRGDILQVVVNAPAGIRYFLDMTSSIFCDFFIILAILITLSFTSKIGGSLLLLGGLIFILIVLFIGKKVVYRLGNLKLSSIQSENDVITSYLEGIRQIRSIYGDGYWKEKYNLALRNYWKRYVKYSFISYLPKPLLNFFVFTAIAILVIFSFLIFQDDFIFLIPIIGVYAFSAVKVIPKINNITTNYTNVLEEWPSIENVYHFLKKSRYNTIKNGTRIFGALSDDIIFQNVEFSYYNDQKIIENINFSIKRNKMTALVGSSGSGKSTVISLLLRNYDASKGRILVNGIDLREYDVKTILMKVGYVCQDTFIFNSSIRENISFGGVYSEEQIIEAAKKANIHDFIITLPNGYDEFAGDQGIKLSGGEKQRIAIARALVRDPEILILDEATSNLDNTSEAIVQSAINDLAKNITTFIVAHRLSTIRKADTIFVMSHGRIVESGSHSELMEKGGRYYGLYVSEE